jgi:hypothetical protein
MGPALGIVALVVSALFLVGMVTVLVLLRKGEGPTFSANREYDANRRDAMRVLTGETVDRVPRDQWYRPDRNQVVASDPLAEPYAKAVADALHAVIPNHHGLTVRGDGVANIEADDAWVVPAVSTAALRDGGLARWGEGGRLVIGLVLFNPEPPGGDARQVTLPVQVLFPALEQAHRGDLVREFERLASLGPVSSTD